MTKEEAKLVLDNARPQTKEIDRQFYDDEDLNNALDLAIKALEQNEKLKADNKILAENCLKDLINCHSSIIEEQLLQVTKLNTSEDCVSREQAIKTISTDIQLNLEGRTGLLKYSDEIKDILKTLLDSQEKKLKALPPVRPTFPKGTTNGDIIKALFPNARDWEVRNHEMVNGHYLDVDNGTINRFTVEWWNAPYKRGSENE